MADDWQARACLQDEGDIAAKTLIMTIVAIAIMRAQCVTDLFADDMAALLLSSEAAVVTAAAVEDRVSCCCVAAIVIQVLKTMTIDAQIHRPR